MLGLYEDKLMKKDNYQWNMFVHTDIIIEFLSHKQLGFSMLYQWWDLNGKYMCIYVYTVYMYIYTYILLVTLASYNINFFMLP